MSTFIIAEIGNNHEGSFSLAKKLIKKAKISGADAVKFQVFKVEKYVSQKNKARFTRLKRFQLTFNQFLNLKKYAKKINIKFFSTPFDEDSLDFLINNSSIVKISSGDNNNYQFIDKVLKKNKTCIISTGFLNQNEIDNLIKRLIKKFGKKKITKNLKILHCVSSYPAKKEILNISVIKHLKEKYNIDIGYSDHSLGIQACCLAVGYGATIIEKHFTIDKNYSSFHDHSISADFDEMKKLVTSIREIEKMIGNSKKRIQKDETYIKNISRRSFYARQDISLGERISLNKLIPLRPLVKNTYSFDNVKKIIDKKAWKNFKKGDVIK